MHLQGCPCNGFGGCYATCQCDQIRLANNTYELARFNENVSRIDGVIESLQAKVAEYQVEIERLEECLAHARASSEQLRVQLAGCSVAALGETKDPAKQGDYGWSPAYQDVIDLRNNYDNLRDRLDRPCP